MSRFDVLRQRKARAKAEVGDDELSGELESAGRLLDEVAAAADRAAKAISAQAAEHSSAREQKIDRAALAGELMWALAERAESLHAESRELVRILERAASVTAARSKPVGEGSANVEVPASPRAEANPSSAPLLATQMAAVGSTQLEIEERLRSEFGVADADAILAQVFGAKG